LDSILNDPSARNPSVSPTFPALLWQPSKDHSRAICELNLSPSAIDDEIDSIILTIYHDLSQTANEAIITVDLSRDAVSSSSVKMGGCIYYPCDQIDAIDIRFRDPSIARRKGEIDKFDPICQVRIKGGVIRGLRNCGKKLFFRIERCRSDTLTVYFH
jgi:hypothetical protein